MLCYIYVILKLAVSILPPKKSDLVTRLHYIFETSRNGLMSESGGSCSTSEYSSSPLLSESESFDLWSDCDQEFVEDRSQEKNILFAVEPIGHQSQVDDVMMEDNNGNADDNTDTEELNWEIQTG